MDRRLAKGFIQAVGSCTRNGRGPLCGGLHDLFGSGFLNYEMTEPPEEQAQQVRMALGCTWEIVASIAGVAILGLLWKMLA